ncbi:hypothetical protein ACUR5C_12885 [Aliikangiella sp. IMCC44653]
MHRFPNPGSALDNLINCFTFLYQNISREQVFDLHDMQELLVSNGLISSSGTMGVEALLKGASKDLSRDKSYNQCKMYAELYRVLGWIQSGEKALWYNFTLLGDHIATASVERLSLVEQCFIGMEFPNDVIDVNGNYVIRPFVTILKTMRALGGVLSRDEIIFGPLSLDNDTDSSTLDAMNKELIYYRTNPKEFDAELQKRLKVRGITQVTARNYTRFPLGALKWLDWAHPIRDKINYSRAQRTYKITAHGIQLVDSIIKKPDIRLSATRNKDYPIKSLAESSFYSMLEESGFDISPVQIIKNNAEQELTNNGIPKNVIFSPFQVLDRAKLASIFNIELPTDKRESIYSPKRLEEVNSGQIQDLQSELKTTIIENTSNLDTKSNAFRKSVENLIDQHTDLEISTILKKEYIAHTKDQFYPLIGDIFQTIGLRCDIPPHGVNSRRWDAIILNDEDSIPIEIKSPTEELHISVKAIRQALENKIILQARQAEKNLKKTTSLAIGFELPKERADVASLIRDIKNIYDIDIAVLGIDYLLKISIRAIRENQALEFKELSNKRGIING